MNNLNQNNWFIRKNIAWSQKIIISKSSNVQTLEEMQKWQKIEEYQQSIFIKIKSNSLWFPNFKKIRKKLNEKNIVSAEVCLD